jgi:endonuclease G, mitochondrial
MSNSDATLGAHALLSVRAPPGTEITVIDSGLEVVSTSVGQLSEELPPGVYKVKASAGHAFSERYQVLEAGRITEVAFSSEELLYDSPAPTRGSRSLDPEQAIQAREHSRKRHVSHGSGSSIFVFVSRRGPADGSPARGLVLLDSGGRLLIDFCAEGAHNSKEQSTWAACTAELEPGTYRLRISVPNLALEQTLIALPDWQTQIFLPERTDGGVRHADLVKSSIFIGRDYFEPDERSARLVEVARLGLADRRNVVTRTDLEELFNSEYANPMLGIYGGHLLLLAPELDRPLLADVVDYLRRALGAAHPDVEALAIKLGKEARSPWDRFAVPPMLLSSWNIIADPASDELGCIPEDSLSARVAEARWGSGPWLVWSANRVEKASELEALETFEARSPASELMSSIRRAIPNSLSTPEPFSLAGSSDSHAGPESPPRHGSFAQRVVRTAKLSAIETAIYRAISRGAEDEEDIPNEPLTFDELARQVGLPQVAVRRILSRLERKLKDPAIKSFLREGSAAASVEVMTMTSFETCMEWVPEATLGCGNARPALARAYQWRNHSTISCAFLDGDPLVHERVREVAKVWERYADLTFVFGVESAKADVRVTFLRPGASSVLGTACKHVPPGEPTMVLGAISASTPVEEVWRLVLHEFGHAIGLIHEHQNPSGGINWNEDAAYQYYGKSGWSKEQIDRNVFAAYAKNVTQFAFTSVDSKSIMMYPIPRELTKDQFEAGWNRTLSKADVDFVRQMYPGRMMEPLPEIPAAFRVRPASSETLGLSRNQTRPEPEAPSRAEHVLGEHLTRLRKFNMTVRGEDSRLGEESRDVEPRLFSGLPAETIDDLVELESIALRRLRPVLAIKKHRAELVFREKEDSEVWKSRLTAAQSVLEHAIRAVGRIEVRGHLLGWVGTGWLVAPHVIVTNRHVAREFSERRGESFVFRPGLDGRRMSASVDFLREVDSSATFSFRLEKILYIEADRGPDLAFIEVEPFAGGSELAAPITLATQAPAVTPGVAVIGYPARDSRVPEQVLMQQIFGDVYDTKRLAPGSVTRVDEVRLHHDCSTLGGNSGSVVLDLDSGKAVGLHFSGRFLESNYAVRADLVGRRLAEIGGGRSRRSPFLGNSGRLVSRPGGRVPEMPEGPGVGNISVLISVSIGTQAGESQARAPRSEMHPRSPRAEDRAVPVEGEIEDATTSEAVALEYSDRKGYVENFLGRSVVVPLPQVVRGASDLLQFESNGRYETELRYEHFSVAMSRSRRLCIFSAVNIDGGRAPGKVVKRVGWRTDPRIPKKQQILNECYGNPPRFSRGHMTRREDPIWGTPTEANRGNVDSMHVTNAVPQMQAFNSPIWLGLEDYALQNARDDDMRISVFTGPFLTKSDPIMYGVAIPTLFWKIIAFIHDATGDLCATGYEMSQSGQLEAGGEEEYVFGQYRSPHLNRTTQVSVASIEARTGLRFGDLGEFDPLSDVEEASAEVTPEPLASFEQIRFTR